jgi:exosortase A
MQRSPDKPSNDGTASVRASTWGRTLVLLLLVLGGIVAAFYETAASIVSIWLRSDTFAHGFLIVPISLWLIWEKRKPLRLMNPQPALVPLALMLPVGFGWLLAYLVDVLVVQQFAFVGLLILAIWTVLGTPVTRFLAFPIGFLLLGVPVGEGLVYPMMNFTADFTVGMLRLTGIPVFRDGTFFSIPSGDWSVVEACSGVRYLIAAVTLGILYAYLTYAKTWKRLGFVGVSVGVPIIANGLRAYMIVMIAHLSDMKLAVGVDHLIYGWVFFGIVITILFFIGAIWRDPPQEDPIGTETPPRGESSAGGLATAIAALAIAGLWPGLAWTLERDEGSIHEVKLEMPAPGNGWRSDSTSVWDWRPRIVGADGERYDFFVNDQGTPVGLYLGVYRTQRQGAELLTSQNVMAPQPETGNDFVPWSEKENASRRIRLYGDGTKADQTRLGSRNEERLLVWSWYRVGGRHTANPYLGKVLEASSRLFGKRRDGSLIAIATPYEEKLAEAEETLQDFVDQMFPSIDQELNRALQESP